MSVVPVFSILVLAVMAIAVVISLAVMFSSQNRSTKLIGGSIIAAICAAPLLLVLIAVPTRVSSTRPRPFTSVNIQHPSLDFSAQDDYVADVYSSSQEAARSLARQVTTALDITPSQPSKFSLRIDRERSANVGGNVNETAAILTAFQEELRKIDAFHENTPKEEVSVVMRREKNVEPEISTLVVSYERNGDPAELTADFADKIWVRNRDEFSQRPEAPRKFFVVGGPGSYDEDSHVIKQAASAIEHIVRVNASYISTGRLDQSVYEDVARDLVDDQFSLTLLKTVGGTPLEPADQRLFLLVNYSDDRMKRALERVNAARSTTVRHGQSWRWSGLFFQTVSLGGLCLLATAIFYAVRTIMQKSDLREPTVAAKNGV